MIDMRCPFCGVMMTSHVVVTRHAAGSGGCNDSFTGPELPRVVAQIIRRLQDLELTAATAEDMRDVADARVGELEMSLRAIAQGGSRDRMVRIAEEAIAHKTSGPSDGLPGERHSGQESDGRSGTANAADPSPRAEAQKSPGAIPSDAASRVRGIVRSTGGCGAIKAGRICIQKWGHIEPCFESSGSAGHAPEPAFHNEAHWVPLYEAACELAAYPCQCGPAWTSRGQHDPHGCIHDAATPIREALEQLRKAW